MQKLIFKNIVKLSLLVMSFILSIIIMPKYLNNYYVMGEILNGKVVDTNETPQPFLRVEIEGPSGQFTRFTDENGRFSINLDRSGMHTIKIIRDRDVMIFEIQTNNLQEEKRFEIIF